MACLLLSRGPLDAAAAAWVHTRGAPTSTPPGFALLAEAGETLLCTEATARGAPALARLAAEAAEHAEGRRGPLRGFLLHPPAARRALGTVAVPVTFRRGHQPCGGLLRVTPERGGAEAPWPGRWVRIEWAAGGRPAGRHEERPAELLPDTAWVVVDPPRLELPDAALDALLDGALPGGLRGSAATLLPPWRADGGDTAPRWARRLREVLLERLDGQFAPGHRPLLLSLLRLAGTPLVAQLLAAGATLDAADGIVPDPPTDIPPPSHLRLRPGTAPGWCAEARRLAFGVGGVLAGRLGGAVSAALAAELRELLRAADAELDRGPTAPAPTPAAPPPEAWWVEQEGAWQVLDRLLRLDVDPALAAEVRTRVLAPAERPLSGAPAWDHHAVEVSLAEEVFGVGADRRGDPAWRTALLQLLRRADLPRDEGGEGDPPAAEDAVGAALQAGLTVDRLVADWRVPGERWPALRFDGSARATVVHDGATPTQLARWRWMIPGRCHIRRGLNRLDDELCRLDGGLWLV